VGKLQTYVTREVLNAFVPAFLALLFIMVLGFCVQLLHEGLDVLRLGGLSAHVATFSVPWVLPSAFLTAVIMAFGRLSADNEIMAMQSGGLHLFQIMLPVYALAVVLSAVAGYFHFQALPQAGQRIQLLKFEAIKQILLDKVALSAQRQLSFPPCMIYYDDFRDGRMLNVIFVETREGMPRTVITAAEGRMEADPERGGLMSLTLRRCAVTQLQEGELTGRGTWMARQIILPVKVAPDPEELLSEVKHLNLRQMIKRWAQLQDEVSSHPRLFANPDEAGHGVRRQLDRLNIERAELREQQRHLSGELNRLRQDERRKLQLLIEHSAEQRRIALERSKALEADLVAYMTEMQGLQEEGPEQGSGYDRIAELQEAVRDTRARLEALKADISQADAAVENARRQIRENELKARAIAQRLAGLQEELVAIEQRRRDSWHMFHMTETQEDLRELEIRYHQRFALATAVFTFALVGIPLGIMTRRRNSMVAFGIGFAIMLVLFYPLLILGQIVAEAGLVPVVPAVWSGNALTLVIGLALTGAVLRK